MKIGIRAGHTLRSTGSSGLIDETTEVRKVKAEVIKLLSNYAEIVDLQPPETMAYPDELNYGINLANSSNLDLGFSIHFNNAYTSYDGAIGTEVHVATNSSIKDNIAQRVVNNLAAFGFKNRGVYESPRLGEIRCSNCPWMIIEVCFVEASRDVEIYRSVGVQAIAKAIVEGILGYKIDGNSNQSQTSQSNSNGFSQRTQWLQILCNQLGVKDQNGNSLVEDGSMGQCSRYAIQHLPLLKVGSRGAAVVHIQNLLGVSNDGIFGYGTQQAVINWQSQYGLSADGIVGKDTWISFS